MNTLFKPFHGTYPITQRFGENPGTYHYICRGDESHNGIDYGMPEGNPVLAAHDGVVIVAGLDHTGYGIHCRILAADGSATVYAHLSRLLVGVNATVRTGQQLGLSGNTGNSTGPHLHFEYRVKADDCRTAIDPDPLLAEVERPAPRPVPPPIGETVKVIADVLNIRTEPGGIDIGDILAGQTLRRAPGLMQVDKNGLTWVPLVVWAATGQDGEVYLE